jgi:hypothetical protein
VHGSFINPLIYTLAQQNINEFFFDIVVGDNKCGEDITACCPYGFPSAIGWDATTYVLYHTTVWSNKQAQSQ